MSKITKIGLPSGGTTGQVLKKKTGTNYDVEWGTGGGGSGTVTSVATTAPITGGTITTTGTIGITQATTSTDGYLSSTDWNTFNNKQSALTNPVTGTGTTNYLPKFTGASTIGDSQVRDNGTGVAIGGAPSAFKFDVTGLVNFTGTTASDGGQLGAELLSAAGWTSTGWTGSFGAGWTHTVGNTTALTNTLAAVNGTYYQIAYTVTGRTAGTFVIAFGGYTSGSLSATGNVGPRATSTGTLSITPTTDFDGTIVISIKVITAGSANLTIKNSSGTVINEINGSSSNTNTFIGLDAGIRNTTGANNTFIGNNAGQNNTTGVTNVFIGTSAGGSNTIGFGNSAYGVSSLQSNTTGYWNSSYGYNSLLSSTTGYSNSAFGEGSLLSSTTSANNSAFGRSTLRSLTSGSNNAVFGAASFYYLSSGDSNIAIGQDAGTYFGISSSTTTTSNNSIFIGRDSRPSADSETNQLVIGYQGRGLGSNTTVIGNSSTTYGRWWGNLLVGSNTNSGEALQITGLASFTGTTASDGGQLGAELLSTSGWTSTGWTGSFATGWTHTTGNTTALTNTLAAVNGNYYQITYTVTGRTAGSFTIAFGGYSIAGITATGNTGPQAISTGTLSITPTTDFDGTIVISIKVITAGSANLTIKNSAGTVINEINGSSSNTNIFVGLDAGSRNTTGLNNTFLGSSSGLNNTNGTDNSFFGYISGQSNTVGSNNTFLGSFAGWSNTIGGFNTFVGSSGRANTTGNFNCYFGARAGISSTTTSGNCFFGYEAGRQTTGSTNSFYGYQSGTLTTSGSNNVGFGLFSGLNNTTGSNNSFFGSESGRRISSGSNLTVANNSIFLGYDTRANADSETNQLVIGYAAIGLGSNTTVIGNSSTTYGRWWGNLLVGTSTNSGYALDVSGTARIQNDLTISDTRNIILSTTTGTKIGTATTQKLSFWNAAPVSQPTTAVTSATRVGGGGTTLTDTDTFDGYTLAQIVKALRNTGILA